MGEERRIPAVFVAPDLRRAGAETQVVDLVNGLDVGRFQKTLFTFGPNLDQRERLDSEQVRHFSSVRQGRFDGRPLLQLARLIRRERTAVLHCTLQISTFFGWLACALAWARPALVASIHTTLNRSDREEAFDRFLYRWVLGACRRVVFVCERQRDHWVRKYPTLYRRSAVVYNGVAADRFDPARFEAPGESLRKRLGIPAGAQAIACIAGFRPEKGHPFLVSAFAGLSGMPYLLLAGDGETRPDVERRVAEAGLSERVRFLGAVSDVRPILALADVSVLASTAVETFSMAMLESMSMETPVVGTRLGGFEEGVVDGETGRAVAPGDVEALREALRWCLDDATRLRRMGAAARRRVRERFSRDRMVRETGELLAESAAEGGRFWG